MRTSLLRKVWYPVLASCERPLLIRRTVKKRTNPTSSNAYTPLKAELDLDEDGRVMPYDPECEGHPQLAIYHEDFTKTEEMLPKICNSVVSAYEELRATTGYSNEEIERVCRYKFKVLGKCHWADG